MEPPVAGRCRPLQNRNAQNRPICDQQQSNGGWEGVDVVDEIVNTLLSLKRHEKIGGPSDLTDRATKAILFLNERFLEWNITKTDRIAFVPRILHLLEEENISFQFQVVRRS